jgi:hypothetical protein
MPEYPYRQVLSSPRQPISISLKTKLHDKIKALLDPVDVDSKQLQRVALEVQKL